jgi:L-ribulose-5-phosphate 3-epimerase UlaE
MITSLFATLLFAFALAFATAYPLGRVDKSLEPRALSIIQDCLVLNEDARKDVIPLVKYQYVTYLRASNNYQSGAYSYAMDASSTTLTASSDANQVNVFEFDFDNRGTIMFWLAKDDQCKVPDDLEKKLGRLSAGVYSKL